MPFESVEVCLDRPCTALTILNFRELLHLFVINKGKYTKIANRYIKKGKPRAALGLHYQLTSVVGVQITDLGMLVVLIFAGLYD